MAPVGKIAEFDVTNGNWVTYVERLKMYFKVNAVNPEMEVPTLIAVVGDTAYELIANLVSPRQVAELDMKTIVSVVGDHLHPKPSVMAERYRFRQRRQLPTETISQYVAALKKMSRFCEFKTAMEENLKDQLVCGLKSDIVRQRLFAESALTYHKAICLATSLEAAEKDAAAVEEKHSGNMLDVNYNYATGAGQRGGGHACSVCGHSDHQATACKFKTYRCGFCDTVGHLRKVCQVRRNNPGAGGTGYGPRGGQARGGQTRGRAGSFRGSRGGRQYGRRRFEQPTYYLDEEEKDRPDQQEDPGANPAESSDEEAIYQMSLRNYPAVQ